jgi:hypothetical protein
MEHREGDAEERDGKRMLVGAGREDSGDRLRQPHREQRRQGERKQVPQKQDEHRLRGTAWNLEPGDLRLLARGGGAIARSAFVVRDLKLFDERLGDGAFVTCAQLDEDSTYLAALLFLDAEPGPQIFGLDVSVAQ